MKFAGPIAYAMWAVIHVLYLIGWGNRLGTLYTWARALSIGQNRGHRVITFDTAKEDVAEAGSLRAGRHGLPLSATRPLPPSGTPTEGSLRSEVFVQLTHSAATAGRSALRDRVAPSRTPAPPASPSPITSS